MYVCIDIHTYIVGTPTPCPFQKLSNLRGGVQNFLLERRDKPGKEREIDVEMGGGVAIFLLLYSSITFTMWEE